MAWSFNGREPVFMQIVQRLRADIICGKYSPDEQFPSVRQLASIAAVNPNTMQKALTCLEEEGLLYNKGTVGRFVTVDEAVIDRAREELRRQMVKNMLFEARALGITENELINYIIEEGKRT